VTADTTTALDRLLDRVPVDEITATANRITPGRSAAAIIGGLLFAVGWLIAKAAGGIWFVAKWSFAAALIGWKSARGEPLLQPDIGRVLAENAALREEVRRLGG